MLLSLVQYVSLCGIKTVMFFFHMELLDIEVNSMLLSQREIVNARRILHEAPTAIILLRQCDLWQTFLAERQVFRPCN